MFDLRRRKFITLLGGAAAAWPLAASAQQSAMPVIGFFHLTSLETRRDYLAAFRRGLGEIGYVEGANVAIEYRWAQGDNDQLPGLVAELVRKRVSVIVILESTHGALSAKAATGTIPIVLMQGADPVRIGLVSSLNRPNTNLTGINLFLSEVVAKRLGLLLELAPAASVDRLSAQSNQPRFWQNRNERAEGCGTYAWSTLAVDGGKSPRRRRNGLCEPYPAAGRRTVSGRGRLSSC